MPPGIGYSFQPGADQAMGPGGQQGKSVAPPASSVKVLSYRMPKQDVRGAIAPASLLNASGAAGAATGGLSPQLLSLLLSAFSAPTPNHVNPPQERPPNSGFQGPADQPNFPTPKFTIGDGGMFPDYGQAFAGGGASGEIPHLGLTGPQAVSAPTQATNIGMSNPFTPSQVDIPGMGNIFF